MLRRQALLKISAVCAALILSGCTPSTPTFQNTDITGADFGKNFTLTDHTGKTRSLSDYQGKVVLIFFGFTQCPDVCPTALNDLAEVKRQLGTSGDKVQGVFITVDPQRDTPEVLQAYMASFDPSFVALRGTPEQLAQVVQEFKVYFKKVEGQQAGAYTMDHAAASFVYDTQGRLRLYVRANAGPKVLLEDLRLLLKQA